MIYCKNYCEEEGIGTSKLNEAQKTLYYIAENMKMDKSISEEGYRHFQMAIKALEQEPKTGHWKLVYRECGTVFYLCSRCNEGRAIIDGDNYKSLDEFKICPNCGARMVEIEGA